jgi:protoporphyrinogen oxidase
MADGGTAVLGAGALGLTIAYRLAGRGQQVTVIERESQPGGLAAGFPVATAADGSVVYLEKFYHHLFRADHAVIDLIEELGLSDRLVWPSPSSAVLRDGAVYRLDGALALLRFKPLPFLDRIRLGTVIAYLKTEKVYQRLECWTVEEWLCRWAGPKVYRTFAEPLLQQKFGEFSSHIAMPWFWSRIHLRSRSLGYLQGGFQQLYDALAERITAAGGTVRLGSAVSSLEPLPEGGLLVSHGGKTERFDRVVSTLPARLTIGLTPAMPEDFKARYAEAPALGAHCLVLEMDRPLTNTYWIAINEPGFPFLAVVEHTNYMPKTQYQGKHLVYIGNYLPMSHPIYRETGDETFDRFLPYLQRLAPDFDPASVKAVHAFSAPNAQPVVTTRFRQQMAPHVTPIPNLYLATMFQIYPQDRGQNYSVAMADRIVRLMETASGSSV